MNNWLTCLIPSTDMNTALCLCHKVQHKPDLLQMEPAKENPRKSCSMAAPRLPLDTSAKGRHRAQISLIVLSEGQYSEGPAEDM